jgi:hypothetical protein
LIILSGLYRILLPFREGALAILPGTTLSQDGFATTHNVEFLEETRFKQAFTGSGRDIPLNISHISWRAHICCWGADHALNLKGDFVELGVWWGVLPKTVCELFKDDPRFINRPYYLVDSWGKMSGSHPDPNYQADIYQQVRARFAAYSNVRLVRGLVPEVLLKVTPPLSGRK